MKMLLKDDIDAYVADNKFRKRDPKFGDVDKYKARHRKEAVKKNGYDKTFTANDFKFADDLSYCICPAGKRCKIQVFSFTEGDVVSRIQQLENQKMV